MVELVIEEDLVPLIGERDVSAGDHGRERDFVSKSSSGGRRGEDTAICHLGRCGGSLVDETSRGQLAAMEGKIDLHGLSRRGADVASDLTDFSDADRVRRGGDLGGVHGLLKMLMRGVRIQPHPPGTGRAPIEYMIGPQMLVATVAGILVDSSFDRSLLLGPRAAVVGVAVPITHGIAHTFTDGNEAVASSLAFVNHELSQLTDSLFVDVVGEDEVTGDSGIGGINCVREGFFGRGVISSPVASVEIQVDDVVTQLIHHLEGLAGCRQVRGPEVGRHDAQDGKQSLFVLVHVRQGLFLGHGGKIRVSPGMAADLMTGRHHAAKDGGIAMASDLIPVQVATTDEKGGADVLAVEQVKQVASVGGRAIVESQSYGSRDGARSDDLAVGE